MKKNILQSLLVGSVPLIWTLTDNPKAQAQTSDTTANQPITTSDYTPVMPPTSGQPTTTPIAATPQSTVVTRNQESANPIRGQNNQNKTASAQQPQIKEPVPTTTSAQPSTNQLTPTTSHLTEPQSPPAGSITNDKNNQPETASPTNEALTNYSNLLVAYLADDNAVNQTDFQLTQNATFNGNAVNVGFSTAKNLNNAAMQAYLERVFENNQLASIKIFPNQNIKTFLTLTSTATGNTVSAGKTFTIPIKVEYYDTDGTKLLPTKTLLDESGNGVMIGGSWTTNPLKIHGYHWNGEWPANAVGHWDANFDLNTLDTDGNLLIQYVYLANPQTAKINFIDQTTGSIWLSKTITGGYKTKANLAPINDVLTTLKKRGYRIIQSNLPQTGFFFNGDAEQKIFTIIIALTGINSPNPTQNPQKSRLDLNPVVSIGNAIGLKKANLMPSNPYSQQYSKNHSSSSNDEAVPPNHFKYHIFKLRPIDWRAIIQGFGPTTSALPPAVVLNKATAFPTGGSHSPSQLGRYLASLSGTVNFGEIR